jgi:hypothetical protein
MSYSFEQVGDLLRPTVNTAMFAGLDAQRQFSIRALIDSARTLEVHARLIDFAKSFAGWLLVDLFAAIRGSGYRPELQESLLDTLSEQLCVLEGTHLRVPAKPNFVTGCLPG